MSEFRNILGKTPIKLMPGMSQVIHAGERFRIQDSQGDEIELEARDDERVLDFIRAFDLHRSAQIATAASVPSIVLTRLAREMESAYQALPDRVKSSLPSSRTIGTYLP